MTKKISEKLIEKMKILRANGLTCREIQDVTGVGLGTVSKYVKEVQMLPTHLRKNPFEDLQVECSREQFDARTPTYENLVKGGYIKDLDFYLDKYEAGTRFKGPLDKISLKDLQKLMAEPTDYHSPLSMKDWCVHYLEGKENRFLKHKPHKWRKTQYEIFDYWENHQRLMVETFRDVGKTKAAEAIIIREMCENRDNNYFIMSETRVKAGKRVKNIGNVLLTNKKIIADYGFLPHIDKYEGYKATWKSDELTIKRAFKQTDPSLMAFSSDSANATGAHFAGGIFDDVWSFKLEQNSLKNKEKWLGWYDGELEGCLEGAWELWLLTRKGVTDLYQDMEDRQFHVVYRKPAVIKFPTKYEYFYKEVAGHQVFDYVEVFTDDWLLTDDGNGLFTMEFFLEKKKKMPADKWESEYQLNPTAATGIYWKRKDLRWIDGKEDYYRRIKSKNSRTAGFMDLAFGTSPRADFTALSIIGYWERDYFLLEAYIKRGATDNDLVNMMKEACTEFPEMRVIYIEADLQQTEKVKRLQKLVSFVSIRPFLSRQEQKTLYREDSARKIQLDGKALRIWTQLEPLIADHHLYINKYLKNLKEFMDEFRTFPVCEHFDILDATGNGCSAVRKTAVKMFILSGTDRPLGF